MKRIFLYGPPASGKTTLGKRLAQALRVKFADLDACIEERTGKTIPEIFSGQGEEGFRKIETETLRETIDHSEAGVISLGGGTLLKEENRAIAEAAGRIWRLDAPSAEELARRIALKPGARPLGDKARERAAHYATFSATIAATFDLGDSLVLVGAGLGGLDGFAKLAVADTNAALAHDGVLGEMPVLQLPSGEQSKRIETVCAIWEECRRRGVSRRDRILSFGGGVTSDMVGFAAATWMRGIGWINMPTTLLSMVDASTGGKTGFDLPEGKNLVGAFHAPELVVIDVAYLSTLPGKELASGRAEMIKHEVISGKLRMAMNGMPTAQEVAENLSVKVEIVRRDSHETLGLRELLNCGHTIGHAVESASGYRLTHGEAVAIGCVEEARLAVSRGLAPVGWPDELAGRFLSAGLPVYIPDGIDYGRIAAAMASDKKRAGNGIIFALPCGWGNVRRVAIPLEELAWRN